VAATLVGLLGRFSTRRGVQFVEEKPGVFALQGRATGAVERVEIADGHVVGQLPASLATTLRGNRVELVLQSTRFLFRPLELPGRAAEFIEGVVRSQIDRLTPWTPGDAVFGWTQPVEAGPERIVVTVAATARAMVMPLVQALAGAGAATVALSTLPQDPGPAAGLCQRRRRPRRKSRALRSSARSSEIARASRCCSTKGRGTSSA
jgi:general secretion pathway protein L